MADVPNKYKAPLRKTEKIGLKLEKYYNLIRNTLLPYQSGDLGLFRTFVLDNNYGHVKDNVYCAMSLWVASVAFRSIDDTTGISHELEYSSIKCMRAILFCWMQQAKELEDFKLRKTPEVCIGSLFHVNTGKPYDKEYSNLQIDSISLYILTLCQMIASGSRIIYTKDESSFVQNLVFSIERAYRTVDYGVWEKGSRFAHVKELHSSSIGMAKAALEAANGFNLFGANGDPSSVMYSDPDAHYRNDAILHQFLPRESFSKNIDAALLTIVGFPAFSVNGSKMKKKIFENIESKLKGVKGYKRYPCDFCGIPLDDVLPDARKISLKLFEGYESEWPIFHCFKAITSVFLNDDPEVEKCRSLIKNCLVKNSKGFKMLPMYYYIKSLQSPPADTARFRYPEDDTIFLWGQSVYIVYLFLSHDLIKCSAIDRLHRFKLGRNSFMPTFIRNRHCISTLSNKKAVVQICLLAESQELQTTLSTYGVNTQNLTEIQPALLCDPDEFTAIFNILGRSTKFGLTGRPIRPTGLLCAAKVYYALGHILITFPRSMDDPNFYMSRDIKMMIDDLKDKIIMLSKLWNMHNRPTIFLLLKPDHFTAEKFVDMMKFLYDLKSGFIPGVRIKLDKFRNLLNTACVEYLDFIPKDYNIQCHSRLYLPVPDVKNQVIKSFVSPKILIDKNVDSASRKIQRQITVELTTSRENLSDKIGSFDEIRFMNLIQSSMDLPSKLLVLKQFVLEKGLDYEYTSSDGSYKKWNLRQEIQSIFTAALSSEDWENIRFAGGLQNKIIDALTPSITSLVVSGKILVIGCYGSKEFNITEPLTPQLLHSYLRDYILFIDPREVCLQQELIVNIANIMNNDPRRFAMISKIHIGWIIYAMKCLLKWSTPNENLENLPYDLRTISIHCLSPYEINQLLYITLSGEDHYFLGSRLGCINEEQKRVLDGALCIESKLFSNKIWKILENSFNGLQLFEQYVPQLPTLAVMTPDEINFSILIEIALSGAKNPESRRLCVEMVTVISSILDRNPEMQFNSCISIEDLIKDAKRIYIDRMKTESKPLSENQTSISNQNNTLTRFESLPCDLKSGTLFYMTHAVINKFRTDGNFSNKSNNSCVIS